MKYLLAVVFLSFVHCHAQSAWPAVNWNAAENVTAALDADGTTELSGLHWNHELFRLYVVHGDGRLHVLQYSPGSGIFSEIADELIPGGPEGITQANPLGNEFYTIDENNYEIRKYIHDDNFDGITLTGRWDLLTSPSPMEDTGNIGPEGIVFIPDSSLAAAGFISSEFNLPYVSTKGMGGLMFVAHQDEGYIWVFDINPNVDDDFQFVGKYRTNRSESCDLAFDVSAGMLYILHNLEGNYVEVGDLSTSLWNGERKFSVVDEYLLPVMADNANIEGFAILNACPETNLSGAWLCRDVEMNEGDDIKLDSLRFFSPFVQETDCSLDTAEFDDNVDVYPNPADDSMTIKLGGSGLQATIRIYDAYGKFIMEYLVNGHAVDIEIAPLSSGMYVVQVLRDGRSTYRKFIKN